MAPLYCRKVTFIVDPHRTLQQVAAAAVYATAAVAYTSIAKSYPARDGSREPETPRAMQNQARMTAHSTDRTINDNSNNIIVRVGWLRSSVLGVYFLIPSTSVQLLLLVYPYTRCEYIERVVSSVARCQRISDLLLLSFFCSEYRAPAYSCKTAFGKKSRCTSRGQQSAGQYSSRTRARSSLPK